MEDEIDLRKYVRVLFEHWRLIVSLGIVAAVIAGMSGSLVPPVYEAEALVVVALPRYALRLASASPTGSTLPLKAYPELALSDNVLLETFNQLRPKLPAELNNLDKFREKLKATPAADPTLLSLTSRDNDPERAARIANVWAQVFARRAGQLYGQDAANLSNYQAQLQTTKNELENAEQSLAAFQSGTQELILQAQLDSIQSAMTDSLRSLYTFEVLAQDAQDLLARLETLDPAAPSTLSDDLSVLSFSSRLFGGLEASLQLQVASGQSLSGKTVAEQKAFVKDLIVTVQKQAEAAQAKAAALEPEILTLQGQLAQTQKQVNQLTRERNIAAAQYMTLQNRFEEAQIAAQELANIVQVASEATVPTVPAGITPLVSALFGGVLGSFVSVFFIIIWEWWGEGEMVSLAVPANRRNLSTVVENAQHLAEPASAYPVE